MLLIGDLFLCLTKGRDGAIGWNPENNITICALGLFRSG